MADFQYSYTAAELQAHHDTVAANGGVNILINGNFSVNQRGVADWASVAVGEYGWDRFRKVSSTTIRQPVEDGGYVPSVTYTLSHSGNPTGTQITSPASGHWDSSDLDIPNTVEWVKLELGTVATEFVPDPPQENLAKCQRYFQALGSDSSPDGAAIGMRIDVTSGSVYSNYTSLPVVMRATPTVSNLQGDTAQFNNYSAVFQSGWGRTSAAATSTGTSKTMRCSLDLDAEI